MSAALPADARGAVQIEFLAAIVPLFLLLICLVQLVLLQVAQLVVQHAATRGVRAAIVILSDTRRDYGGAAPGEIGGGDEAYTERQRAIARAAGWPLLAITPSALRRAQGAVDGTSVADALDGGTVADLASRALDPRTPETRVEFPRAPGSTRLHEGRVPLRGQLHLRVRHAFECRVPFARTLFCDASELDRTGGVRVRWLEGEATLAAQPAAYDELRDGD